MSLQGIRFISLSQTSSDEASDQIPAFGGESEPLDALTLENLNHFHGAEGFVRRHAGQTGAGTAEEEDLIGSSQMLDTGEQSERWHIDERNLDSTNSQLEQIKHSAIPVPDHRSPFQLAASEARFNAMLLDVERAAYLPANINVQAADWGEEGYPLREEIPVGFRTQRRLSIELPSMVWLPRAIRWAQAITLLNRLLEG